MAGYALAKYEFVAVRPPSTQSSPGAGAGNRPCPAAVLDLRGGRLTNTWSVLLPSLVSPFGYPLSRIYASASVPDALIEAARLDGVGEFRSSSRWRLRWDEAGAGDVFLFQFVVIWNNFPAAHHAGRPKAVPR